MTVTKPWGVVAMDSAPSEGSLSDVVKTIHRNCTGTETVGSGESVVTYNSYAYGCVELAAADSNSFKEFASITKDNAIAWAQSAIGTDEVAIIETGLENKINEQKTPSIETKDLPWT